MRYINYNESAAIKSISPFLAAIPAWIGYVFVWNVPLQDRLWLYWYQITTLVMSIIVYWLIIARVKRRVVLHHHCVCPKCGYPFFELGNVVCSECGEKFVGL